MNRNRTLAADLQQLLRDQSPEWSVLAFGNHGTSPAFHLDVLDYAQWHFGVQEAVVLLYLGNDVNESSPALNYSSPEAFIYYDLDAAGQLALLPASAACRTQFNRSMEFSHQSVWTCLPVTLNSHCMTLQLILSIRDTMARNRKARAFGAADPETAKYGRFGLSLKPFATTPDLEARHAFDVMFAELTLLKQKCETNHIALRLVTIPFFPPQFYASQHGPAWTLKLGEYDFLAPDREVAAFAQAQGIPFLSFADWLVAKKMSAEDIRNLYFTAGSGHFTEQGHRRCAEAIFETFYASQKP